ncbi:MAG: DUF1351 domain-containing protein [Hespellia sp.]|nr:DUF1351 domain-containing protein [Hespellia sp.]
MGDMKVLVQQQAGVIDFSNFDSIKSELSAKMEEYKGFTFTEDS